MMQSYIASGARGTLLYDHSIDRPVVVFARGGYSAGLPCGQALSVLRDGQIIQTRLELDPDGAWYYAGTTLRPQSGDTVYLDCTA